MTDLYMDQPGSKKKYLVPLLILLLCAVSLTGAGFAYNSSVTVETDDPVHSFELQINGDNTIALDSDVYFNSVVTSTSAEKKTVYSVDTAKTKDITFQVKINSNANYNKAETDLSATVSSVIIELREMVGGKLVKVDDTIWLDVNGIAKGTKLTTTATDVTVKIGGSLTYDYTNVAEGQPVFDKAPSEKYVLFVSIVTDDGVETEKSTPGPEPSE